MPLQAILTEDEFETTHAFRCKECARAYRTPVRQCLRCGALFAMEHALIREERLVVEESMPLLRRVGRLRPDPTPSSFGGGGMGGGSDVYSGETMNPSMGEEMPMMSIQGEEEGEEEEDEEDEDVDEEDDTEVSLLYSAKGQKILRLSTGDDGFDHVLDGGTMVGGVVGIAAQPGGGKSTMLRKVGAAMAHMHGLRVLINCPEESKDMLVKARKRLQLPKLYPDARDKLFFASARKLETVLRICEEKEIDVLIQDSVDYGTSDEIQANLKIEMTKKLCDRAHSKEEFEDMRPVTMFLVYHSTKKDTIMGSNTVTHAVDAFVWMEHVDPTTWIPVPNQDIPTGYVCLRIHKKNRFGSPLNKAFYFLGKNGLERVDPTTHKPRQAVVLGRKQPRDLGSATASNRRSRASRKAPTRARAAPAKDARARLNPR